MWSIAIKTLRSNLSRFVATLIAIAVGVGFLTAGTMITNSIENSLGGEIDRQYAGIDVAVSPHSEEDGPGGESATFPPDVLTPIQGVDGVGAAVGEVVGVTKLPLEMTESDNSDNEDEAAGDIFDQGPSVRSWVDDDALNPIDLVDGSAPQEGQVTVDRGLADEHNIEIGSTLELATADGFASYQVSGTTGFGTSDSPDPGGTITAPEPGVFALAGLARPAYAKVLVSADEGVTAATLKSRIEEALAGTDGANLDVLTGAEFRDDQKGDFAAVFSVLRPVLQGFSGLAIFVCAFVISNTFRVIVGQRTRELALMRAIAATPRQVRRSLRVEGLGIGFIGSVLGLALGTLLTFVLSKVFVALDLDLPKAQITLTPGIVIAGLLVGTLVTFVSVQIPAWRAGRTAPVEAMRESAVEPKGVSKVRLVIALVMLLGGIGLMLTRNAWLLGLGAPIMLIGVFLTGPAFAYWFARLTRPVLRRLGMAGRLSSDNIARNPNRTSTTTNALVIGLMLVTLVTVAGNSLKKTTVDEINKYSSADFIMGAQTGAIDPTLFDRVEQIDGVTTVARLRQHMITGEVNGPPFLVAADPEQLAEIGVKTTAGSLDEIGDGVAIPDFDGTARLGEIRTYIDPVAGPIELEVTAILDFSIDSFSLGNLVSAETLDRIAPDRADNGALLKVDRDRRDEVARELKKVTAGYGNVQVVAGNIFGKVIEVVFDFLINAVNGLLGMSIVIALIGIVNTLTLSIFERRRELGLLRAVGMTSSGVRRMIRLEALQMAILGTLVGMGTGLLLGWLLLRASDLGSLDVQWGRMAILFGIGLLLGIVAAIAPTRRVTKLNVLEAIEVT